MPTKTEQADLLMAMYGRHGECPLVVLAAATPADCFPMAFEAVRLAIKYMTPVMLLSDSFLANSAEPWRIVDPDDLPDLRVARAARRRATSPPIAAIPETLVAALGRSRERRDCEHRIGGLEKEDVTGSGELRRGQSSADGRRCGREKIEGIARDIPPAEVAGPAEGDLLVVGWGSTYGAIAAAVDEAAAGRAAASPTCTCAT